MVTTPARPNSRISASPMTKGGVMIGRIDSTRSSGFIGMRVRSATSAKARPSSVVSTPTSVASATVFHATPQLRPPVTQSRLQIDGLNSFVREQRGREAAIVVADRGGQDAEHRIEHEQRDQSHHQQDRADHEHVALAHAQPRQAVGEQHEAGERVERGAPAHGRLHSDRCPAAR